MVADDFTHRFVAVDQANLERSRARGVLGSPTPEGLKGSLAACRREIASLKRRVSELERALNQAGRVARRRIEVPAALAAEGGAAGHGSSPFRFQARGLASNRKRLGLSAEDFGLLVGASGQSVYAWEQGKAKPRGESLQAIAAIRGAGKREVAKRLAELKEDG